jgi:hypothetical protein
MSPRASERIPSEATTNDIVHNGSSSNQLVHQARCHLTSSLPDTDSIADAMPCALSSLCKFHCSTRSIDLRRQTNVRVSQVRVLDESFWPSATIEWRQRLAMGAAGRHWLLCPGICLLLPLCSRLGPHLCFSRYRVVLFSSTENGSRRMAFRPLATLESMAQRRSTLGWFGYSLRLLSPQRLNAFANSVPSGV